MNGRENGEEIQKNSLNALVFRLIHRYGSLNFCEFQRLGVHPGQLPVFAILREHEGISLRELADSLHIKPPTVTVTIQRLEKVGFVSKKPDEKDQRVNRIYLTEKGKNLSEEMLLLVHENERILMEGFTEEELGLLKDFLNRMIENLAQAPAGACGGEFPERVPFAKLGHPDRFHQMADRPVHE